MGGGQFHSKEVAFLVFPKIYFDVKEIYRQRWLEESGQRPENVDQTKWQVASGKLVLQKKKGVIMETLLLKQPQRPNLNSNFFAKTAAMTTVTMTKTPATATAAIKCLSVTSPTISVSQTKKFTSEWTFQDLLKFYVRWPPSFDLMTTFATLSLRKSFPIL